MDPDREYFFDRFVAKKVKCLNIRKSIVTLRTSQLTHAVNNSWRPVGQTSSSNTLLKNVKRQCQKFVKISSLRSLMDAPLLSNLQSPSACNALLSLPNFCPSTIFVSTFNSAYFYYCKKHTQYNNLTTKTI